MKGKKQKTKNLVIKIDGGIGRQICSTTAIKKLKEQNPDRNIDVICACPEIFKFNPNVNRVYPLNHSYLFEDVIKGNELLTPEPYTNSKFFNDEKHLIEVIGDELNVEVDSVKPDLFFSKQELSEASKFLIQQKKPVVLFQPWGQDFPNGELYRKLDGTFAQMLCNELIKKGYSVVQVSKNDQAKLKGAVNLNNVPLRNILALIPYCKAVVGVDSMLQHAARACDKKAVVFWGGTDEKRFGYDFHKNIRAVKLRESYPFRLEHNVPAGFHYNVGVNTKFDEKHISKVIKTIKKW